MEEVTGGKLCPVLSRVVPIEGRPGDYHLWEIFCGEDDCQMWSRVDKECSLTVPGRGHKQECAAYRDFIWSDS
jgi:hypothetical protein